MKLEFHCRVHKSLVLSQMNPVDKSHFHYLLVRLHVQLFHVVSFLQGFEIKPCRREISPNRVTCFTHFILFGMIARIIYV